MATTGAAAHLYRRITRVVFASALMVAGSGFGASTRAAAMASRKEEQTLSFGDDGEPERTDEGGREFRVFGRHAKDFV